MNTVVHVSEAMLCRNGGMGRVAYHWKLAFEARGIEFIQIGPEEVGPVRHAGLFPRAALRFFHENHKRADMLLVHEPSAGVFIRHRAKLITVSHGLERRMWELQTAGRFPELGKLPLKTRLLFPIWRLRGADRGLRSARGALLINEEDRAFALHYYRPKNQSVFVFKNGTDFTKLDELAQPQARFRVLYIGTWTGRKGVGTLSRAARLLHQKGVTASWVLAGTGVDRCQVLRSWPAELHGDTEVIARFPPEQEETLYGDCNAFVLPSLFEGQPLVLLQAMRTGRCCITTDTCGQKDVIAHRRNGLLYPPGDASILASLLEEVAATPQLRHELGRAARLSMYQRSWPAVSDDVVNFAKELSLQGEG